MIPAFSLCPIEASEQRESGVGGITRVAYSGLRSRMSLSRTLA